MTKGNSKWISIGVDCSPKAAFQSSDGFTLNAYLCGDKHSPMKIGGVTEILIFFRALRSNPELERYCTETASDYADVPDIGLFMMNKMNFANSRCIQIVNQAGDSSICTHPTIEELFRREQMILAAIKAMKNSEKKVEVIFNNLVMNASKDYDKTIENVEKSDDLISIDIISNFIECFDFCVNLEKSKSIATTLSSTDNTSTSGASQISATGNASTSDEPIVNDNNDASIKARRTYNKK